jgi:hypothetical protein
VYLITLTEKVLLYRRYLMRKVVLKFVHSNYLIPIIVILLSAFLFTLNSACGVKDIKTLDIEEISIIRVMVWGAITLLVFKILFETICLFFWANYIKKIKIKFSSLLKADSLTFIPILIHSFLNLLIPSKYGGIFSIGYFIEAYLNELPPFVVFVSKNFTVFIIAEIVWKGYVIRNYITTPLIRGIIIVIFYVLIMYYSEFVTLRYLL